MQCGIRTSFRADQVDWRRKKILAGQIAAILLVPLILVAFPSNPPAGESGAAAGNGGSSCGTNSCHFHGTATSTGGITLNAPTTYTPGGPAVPLTVAVASGSGGFELSAVQGSGTTETQAGTFTNGTGTADSTLSGIDYIFQTGPASSFSFTWTPPATSVGNITMNLAGVQGSSLFANTYTLTPAAGGGGSTVTVNPTTLTFNSSGGATPPTQIFQVTSSGAALAFTTSVSTSSGGSWLTATPSGANTPMAVTVSASPTGLATGTYTGTVTVAAATATNSPQTVSVTFNVTGGPPPSPMMTLTPGALTFNAANNQSSVAAQNVQVTDNGTALSFSTLVSTNSGGSWLSINPPSGMTPATVSVMPTVSGLSPGTYTGSVTFTAAAATNSPQTLSVTLVVGSSTQPPPGSAPPLTFTFSALDRQSNGNQRLHVSGRGSIDGSGQIKSSGLFTIYTSTGDEAAQNTLSTGTWTATGVTSFTSAGGGGTGGGESDGGRVGDEIFRNTLGRISDDGGRSPSGGTLVITVNIVPAGGGSSLTGTMTIASTGTSRGVTLAIDGGQTFVPSGTAHVSIFAGSGGTGSGGTGTGGTDN